MLEIEGALKSAICLDIKKPHASRVIKSVPVRNEQMEERALNLCCLISLGHLDFILNLTKLSAEKGFGGKCKKFPTCNID